MKKKYYILALTFLCLLIGQSSFGQGTGGDYEEEVCTDERTDLVESLDCVDIYYTLGSYYYCESGIHISQYDYESYIFKECGTGDSGDCRDPSSSAYPCDSGDVCDITSNSYSYCGCYPDRCTDPEDPEPDPDCTNTSCPPGYTLTNCECVKEPCLNTCDTGYKLNNDTCECEKLPPCFNSISELDTSNAFDTNKILNNLESFLNKFGIHSDVIEYLKNKKIFDPHILSETAQSYIKAFDYLGNTGDALGIASSVATYLNEPKTENLLRVSFDVASLGLPPGTSLTVGFVELFKNRDGKTIIDLLLEEASKAIEDLMDCDLGAGVHGKLF